MSLRTFLLLQQSSLKARLALRGTIQARKLYTDHIYPYPNKWINDNVHPSQHGYRECFSPPPWKAKEDFLADWLMRGFWFYMFMMLFNNPGVFLGHYTAPDPSEWTDEELGIPPLEAGSYQEWAERNLDLGSDVQDG